MRSFYKLLLICTILPLSHVIYASPCEDAMSTQSGNTPTAIEFLFGQGRGNRKISDQLHNNIIKELKERGVHTVEALATKTEAELLGFHFTQKSITVIKEALATNHHLALRNETEGMETPTSQVNISEGDTPTSQGEMPTVQVVANGILSKPIIDLFNSSHYLPHVVDSITDLFTEAEIITVRNVITQAIKLEPEATSIADVTTKPISDLFVGLNYPDSIKDILKEAGILTVGEVILKALQLKNDSRLQGEVVTEREIISKINQLIFENSDTSQIHEFVQIVQEDRSNRDLKFESSVQAPTELAPVDPAEAPTSLPKAETSDSDQSSYGVLLSNQSIDVLSADIHSSTIVETLKEEGNINTILDVTSKAPADLLAIQGIGSSSVEKIQEALNKKGLKLKPSVRVHTLITDLLDRHDDFTNGIIKKLAERNIKSVGNLMAQTTVELLKILDLESIKFLKETLSNYGLTLRDSTEVISINSLFSGPILQALTEEGIRTLEDLTSKTKKELIKVPGMTPEFVLMVNEFLSFNNLHLKSEDKIPTVEQQPPATEEELPVGVPVEEVSVTQVPTVDPSNEALPLPIYSVPTPQNPDPTSSSAPAPSNEMTSVLDAFGMPKRTLQSLNESEVQSIPLEEVPSIASRLSNSQVAYLTAEQIVASHLTQ